MYAGPFTNSSRSLWGYTYTVILTHNTSLFVCMRRCVILPQAAVSPDEGTIYIHGGINNEGSLCDLWAFQIGNDDLCV